MTVQKSATKPPNEAQQRLRSLVPLGDKLNELFMSFAEVQFAPHESVVSRFCANAESRAAKQAVCDRFRTIEHSRRLVFIGEMSDIIMPYLSEIVTTPNGNLVLRHTRPGGNDEFRYRVNHGIIGCIIDDERGGTIAMNPLCAILQWLEKGRNPKYGEYGFRATFHPIDTAGVKPDGHKPNLPQNAATAQALPA